MAIPTAQRLGRPVAAVRGLWTGNLRTGNLRTGNLWTGNLWTRGLGDDRVSPALRRTVLASATRRVRSVIGCVTRLGWSALALATAAAAVWWIVGWGEALYMATTLYVLVGLAALMAIGRARLRVDLDVEPSRVTVGESAVARIVVTNEGHRALLPLGLELPVTGGVGRFVLPALASGRRHDQVVFLPTGQRGVVQVGPATTQRGDPFGLVRRVLSWAQPQELFIHPATVPLDDVGRGLLRDLEGRATNDVSMSDLAFHTLRDYAPGDDRRYIHWRSSAKRLGAGGQDGSFLVRQFLDTRRTHLAVVLDCAIASYGDPGEFEVAVGAAASLARLSRHDDTDVSVVAGSRAAVRPPSFAALDTFARAALITDGAGDDLLRGSARIGRAAPDISAAVLVTGSKLAFRALHQAAAHFPPEVVLTAIRVEAGAAMTMTETTGLTVLTIGALADLPVVLAGGGAR